MKIVVFPYKMGSESASNLAETLDCNKVYPDREYVAKERHLIVNWGNTNFPKWWTNVAHSRTLNLPQNVRNASNKLDTFRILSSESVPVVPWTTDSDVARQWLTDSHVVCRTLTSASQGRGITVAARGTELVPAIFYTKYMSKTHEYRVHVMLGDILDAQQKKLRDGERDNPNRNRYIRNTANGWVFCRENVTVPDAALVASISAVSLLGLHFGAVDIGYNSETGNISIYEVNTAPGIEGTTVQRYAQAIRNLANGY